MSSDAIFSLSLGKLSERELICHFSCDYFVYFRKVVEFCHFSVRFFIFFRQIALKKLFHQFSMRLFYFSRQIVWNWIILPFFYAIFSSFLLKSSPGKFILPTFSAIYSFCRRKLLRKKLVCQFSMQFSHFLDCFSILFRNFALEKNYSAVSSRENA